MPTTNSRISSNSISRCPSDPRPEFLPGGGDVRIRARLRRASSCMRSSRRTSARPNACAPCIPAANPKAPCRRVPPSLLKTCSTRWTFTRCRPMRRRCPCRAWCRRNWFSAPMPEKGRSLRPPCGGNSWPRPAAATGLDPRLIAAVIKVESNFETIAESEKGAQGLMQLMPGTQQMLGVIDPFDPEANVDAGSPAICASRLTASAGLISRSPPIMPGRATSCAMAASRLSPKHKPT